MMSTIENLLGPPIAGDLMDRMARSLAHNLNNRLTGVVGYLELALQEPGMPAAASRHLQTSLECALDVVRMVRRVSAFAVHSTPTLQSCSPTTLLEQAAGRLTQTAPYLNLYVFADSRAHITIPTRLLQLALEQLLDNAVEAMPMVGSLTLRSGDDDGAVWMSVSDSGAGLSDLARDHLFEPFVSDKATGHLGIGLALARMLVQSLGGTLTLESEIGTGTTGTMRLPLP